MCRVCAVSRLMSTTKSAVDQDKMFPCFLHELSSAALHCALCYFYKPVLQSLFSFSTFVGIITQGACV